MLQVHICLPMSLENTLQISIQLLQYHETVNNKVLRKSNEGAYLTLKSIFHEAPNVF